MTASATCEKARPQLLRRSRKRRSPRRHTRTAGGCGKRTKSPNRRAIALPPDEGDFLCADWVWDAALRELRNYPRKGKRHADEPQAVERLKPVRSVTWHRWSQAPMQTATGHVLPPSLSRVVVAYEGGGDLTINEYDRGCAEELASPIETFTVWAVVGAEGEKMSLTSYSGYGGWAEPEEWREFVRELGRSLGAEGRV